MKRMNLWIVLTLTSVFGLAFGQTSPSLVTEDSSTNTQGRVQQREKVIREGNETTVFREKIQLEDNSVGTGIALFLGLDLGLMSVKSEISDLEKDRQGSQVGGRLVGSVYPRNWVFDLGLGWFYTSLEGESRYNNETKVYEPTFAKETIITYAAFAELATRYRITYGWQLGLAAQVLFGTDLSFGSKEQSGVRVFPGAQLFYGIPEKTADFRWGLSVYTDINVPDAQILWGMLSIQIGLPLVKPDKIFREKSLTTIRDKEEKVEVRKEVKKTVVKEVVKFIIPIDTLKFAPKKALLGPTNQRLMLELAQSLNSVSDTWEEFTVEGHVLPQGPENESAALRLSAARAAAVRNALVAAGIATERAKSRGFGSSRPYDSTDAFANSNERLELSFSGVGNAGKLNAALATLFKKKARPETCNEQGCK